jgi:hypothetical protein
MITEKNHKLLTSQLFPKINMFFPFHRGIMWPSLLKIQYTELKLCGNDPVVKNSIYSKHDSPVEGEEPYLFWGHYHYTV